MKRFMLLTTALVFTIGELMAQLPDTTFTVYGQRRFERSSGSPITVTETFSIPSTAAPPYTLYLINGEWDGTDRVSSAEILVNGVVVINQDDLNQQVASISRQVSLSAQNTIDVRLSSQPKSFLIIGIRATDVTAPRITVASPPNNFITSAAQVTVSGTIVDETTITATVNGTPVTLDANGGFTTQVALTEGTNTLTVSATDAFSNTSSETRVVVRDTAPPVLAVAQPTNGFITNGAVVTVSGTVMDSTAVTVTANGYSLTVDPTSTFSGTVPVNEGTNILSVVATDAAGNTTSETRLVIRDTTPPTLTVTQPTNGTITNATAITVAGTVVDSTNVQVTVNGLQLVVGTSRTFSGEIPLTAEGVNTITVTATDTVGNTTTVTMMVIRDTTPPTLTVSQPADSLITRDVALTLSGSVFDSTAITLLINSDTVAVAPNWLFSHQTNLAEGTNQFTILAIDAAGNTTTVGRVVILDTTPPVVSIAQSPTGFITKDTVATVIVSVTDATATTVTANAVPLSQDPSGGYSGKVSLAEGPNTITIVATDAVGNSTSITTTVIRDTAPPVLTVTEPADSLLTGQTSIAVRGTVSDSTEITLRVNGISVSVDSSGNWTTQVALAEGFNTITVSAVDFVGNTSTVVRTVQRSSLPPVLSIASPAEGAVLSADSVQISGAVTSSSTVTLTINGTSATVNPGGSFSHKMPLSEGRNEFLLIATDALNQQDSLQLTVYRDTRQPLVNLISPALTPYTSDSTIVIMGSVVDSSRVTIAINGVPQQVNNIGNFQTVMFLPPGVNTFTIQATDEGGNSITVVRTIERVLPVSDPATVAPKVDRTVSTTVASATEFLYTGSDPIQKNVAPGTINTLRVTALRGKVLNQQGNPLSGVTVRVNAHPEFGYTLSREDGLYDLAVNGGEPVTLDFTLPGFWPAQRTVTAQWQSYERADDVALLAMDTLVHHIDFVAPTGVQGTTVIDELGTRKPTVFFEQGTQPFLVFPKDSVRVVPGCVIKWGSQQYPIPSGVITMHGDSLVPIGGLSMRVQEYSVGTAGENALPAPLPPGVAYTFAFELQADEVISNGARNALLSQPATLLLENVMNFPEGMIVPLGYYDRTKGAWLPSENGRVIRILGSDSGFANIDFNGDGFAENPDTLVVQGISYAEQQYLAGVYITGQSLLRAEFTKSGTYTIGYGFVLPTGAKSPSMPLPDRYAKVDRDNIVAGSVIGVQNQTLGESLPITNSPFTLHYKSDRVEGRREAYTLDIPITGLVAPDSALRMEVEVEVAGQVVKQTYTPQPNITFHFEWDGKDVYGRKLQGQQNVLTTVSYYYKTQYAIPADWSKSFSTPTGQTMIRYIPARKEMAKTQIWEGKIGAFDILSLGIGGWSLSQHHGYDVLGRILYTGDGQTRSARVMDNVITSVAGHPTQGNNSACELYYMTPMPTLQTPLGNPGALRFAADGSILVCENYYKLRKIDTAGVISTIGGLWPSACGGTYPDTLEGIMANCGSFYAFDMVEGPDKSIYLTNDIHIWRITPDGELRHFAGVFYNTGYAGYSGYADGDGGPAMQAHLNRTTGPTVGKDGSLYFADGFNHRIRKISPDGIITTVAGSAKNYFEAGYSGDGGPAILARMNEIRGFAMGSDGSLYLCDYRNQRIRKVTPDGIITTIAGTGIGGSTGDGGLAIYARINYPYAITVGSDGTVYFCETGGKIRAISTDGYIKTVIGGGSSIRLESGPATAAQIGAADVEFGQDGNLYITDWPFYFSSPRIARIGPPMPGLKLSEVLIASEDGSEQYVFTLSGRHLRTLDALTGVTKYTFNYDAENRLASIVDIDSLVTQIERDSTGRATAIISPYGVQTVLTIDTLGHMLTAENPANEAKQFTYTSGGLMTSMTDARGSTYHYEYDSLGYLTKDLDPVGGFTQIARTYDSTGYTITATTAMGKMTKYRVDQLRDGGKQFTTTDPNGLKTTTSDGTNGTGTSAAPSGMQTPTEQKPDPRYGMQSPLGNLTVKSPGGLQSNVNQFRTVTQMSGTQVTGLTDSIMVSGKNFRTQWDGNQRMLTKISPEGRKTFTSFDAKGKVIKDSTAGLASVTYRYDSKGRRIEANQAGRKTTFEYDSLGRQSKVTDPYGRSSYFYYDNSGRLVRTVAPDSSQVLFAYDRNGNVLSITPPSKPEHTFDYSAVDLETFYTPPFAGDSSRATSKIYTFDKEVQYILRPDSLNITIEYGGTGALAGQPKKIYFDRGFVTNLYDTTKGLQIGVVAPNGDSLRYLYDGTLLKKLTWTGNVQGNVAFSYNNDLQVSTETVIPSVGSVDSVNLKYDNDGLMTTVGALKLGYGTSNNLLLTDTLGGVVTNYTYSTLGELASKETRYGANVLLRIEYVRDSLGRITEQRETVDGISEKKNYNYDNVGRLSKVWKNDTLVSEYTYDTNGNRLTHWTPTKVDSGMYDAQDRMLSYGNATYAYSKFGDLQKKIVGTDTTHYTYDAFGSLISISLPNSDLIEYLLDGNGLRVGRKVNGTVMQKWLYSNNLRIVAELDSANNVVSRFVYTTSENVPEYMVRGGIIYRVVTDHLGSVRQVIDTQTGAVIEQVDYDEYGNVLSDSNLGFSPFGFGGGLFDPQTKQVRFSARDYEAWSGRWTTKDPDGFLSGGNLYEYCIGDPNNQRDAKGTTGWTSLMSNVLASRAINIAIGAASGAVQAGFESKGDVLKTLAGAALGAAGSFIGGIPSTLKGQALVGGITSFVGTLGGAMVAKGEITSTDLLNATRNSIMGGMLGAFGAAATTREALKYNSGSLVGWAATVGVMQGIWDMAMMAAGFQ